MHTEPLAHFWKVCNRSSRTRAPSALFRSSKFCHTLQVFGLDAFLSSCWLAAVLLFDAPSPLLLRRLPRATDDLAEREEGSPRPDESFDTLA